MADEMNGNGRSRAWVSKDTWVPIGSLVGFALFIWWASGKYNDLILMMSDNVANVSGKLADQRRETALELQALRFTLELQSQRIERIETSVKDLARGSGK
jgi:hypothetical protein